MAVTYPPTVTVVLPSAFKTSSALAAVFPKTVMTTTGIIHKNLRISFPRSGVWHAAEVCGPRNHAWDLIKQYVQYKYCPTETKKLPHHRFASICSS